ncbi:hypothetical protein PR048_024376 [Dryococelus australis]|uniref:Uncharacterized protein n=1 Tax=Dryococelus australis TaxID=614101 RepID=A0ABQ9GNE4_9NEOP|nr:hypothetical protein PR048_024376 [Dryococelus australis]
MVMCAWCQAALGPVALDMARTLHSDENLVHANKVLVVAVMAILVTAPLGAILITMLGPRLLAKTDHSVPPATLSQSH